MRSSNPPSLSLLLLALPALPALLAPSCPLGDCFSDDDCFGNICVEGSCVECAQNSDCDDGESCRDNSCEPANCDEPRDCGDGFSCVDGSCIAAEGEGEVGEGEGDVGEGEGDVGEGEGDPPPPTCTSRCQCDVGEACVGGHCQAAAEVCSTDNDCPRGLEICAETTCGVFGFCETAQPQQCSTNTDCTSLGLNFCNSGTCACNESILASQCASSGGTPVVSTCSCSDGIVEQCRQFLGAGAADGCDCGCGQIDPDCASGTGCAEPGCGTTAQGCGFCWLADGTNATCQ